MCVCVLRVTVYAESIKSDAPAVRFMWQVLEEFSHEERRLFLKFVWGRSRLPLRVEDFSEKFTIEQIARDNPDAKLPTSHT